MIALLLRDLRLAMRSGGGFGLGLAFFVLVIVLVPLGVGPQGAILAPIAAGVLWVAALLCALLTLDRIFALDLEDGSLELLFTSPIPLEGVALMKALSHWLVTGAPLTIIGPALALLLYLPPSGLYWLLGSFLVGTPALSAIGTLGAALTLSIKRGGLLLSLLVLPLYIPTLILGAEVVRRGILGLDALTPLLLLLGISLASVALLPIVTALALKINLQSR